MGLRGQSSQCECGGSVASHRFLQGCAQFNASFAQLLSRKEAVPFARHDEWFSNLDIVCTQPHHPHRGLLEQAFIADRR